MIAISVIDQGIGMSEKEIKSVFIPFNRSSNKLSKTMNPLSNGVGLSICKSICSQLEGEIKVLHSSPAIGTNLTFSMRVFRESGGVSAKPLPTKK